jgi:hypothetical protein
MGAKYGVLFKSVTHNEVSFLYIINFIYSRVNEMCDINNIRTFEAPWLLYVQPHLL